MKVNRIKISNILGIDELEIEPGSLTVISGPNNSGKTSTLEAIKSALKGGQDATLLRKGSEKGEVVLELQDGRSIIETVTANRTSLALRDEHGRKVASPAKQIKALVDVLATNPLDFITAKSDYQAKILLDTIPIEIDSEKVEENTGMKIELVNQNPLDVLEFVRKTIYDLRTGTGRAIVEKNASINQMEIALEAYSEVNEEEFDENKYLDKIKEIDATAQTRIDKIQSIIDQESVNSEDYIEHLKEKAEIEIKVLEDQIKKIRDNCNESVLKEKSMNSSRKDQARTAQQKIRSDAEESKKEWTSKIEKSRQNVESSTKKKHLQDLISTANDDLEELEKTDEKQTKSINWIDDYKKSLLKSLPIPGLAVIDNKVLFNDIPFERLNEATKVDLAIEIGKLRAGELKIICVDGIERLDPDTFNLFVEKASKSNMQLVVTKVEHDPDEIKKGRQIKVVE